MISRKDIKIDDIDFPDLIYNLQYDNSDVQPVQAMFDIGSEATQISEILAKEVSLRIYNHRQHFSGLEGENANTRALGRVNYL